MRYFIIHMIHTIIHLSDLNASSLINIKIIILYLFKKSKNCPEEMKIISNEARNCYFNGIINAEPIKVQIFTMWNLRPKGINNKVRAVLFIKYPEHGDKINWAKLLQKEQFGSQNGNQSQASAFGVTSSQRRRSSSPRPINQSNLQVNPATFHLNALRLGDSFALILEINEEFKTQVLE